MLSERKELVQGKMELRDAYVAILIFVLSAFLIPFPPYTSAYDSDLSSTDLQANLSSQDFIKPIIYHPDVIDGDLDRIQDSLETAISQMTDNRSAVLPVVVTLYNPVLSQDLDWFMMLGGRITRVYRYVTYGFAGVIPASNISKFTNLEKENLCVIEHDVPVRYHMDVSVPLIRARPVVWDTYGYTGSPNYSIAIIDTGIDDSHLDVGPYGNLNFSRKIVGWYDATPDMSAAPEDYCEHGTHCAGIAAGTGDANPLQASGFVTTTWTYTLEGLTALTGYLDYGFDVMNPGVITLNCTWTSNNYVILQLRDATEDTVLGDVRGTEKPLVLTYNATESGRYRPLVGIERGKGRGYFSLRETYPYQGRNDSYNLFTGVAPTSKLVGVKVFDNTGSATTSTVYGGMDWVIANKTTYNITAVSMSIGIERGGVDTTFDQKADTMVENGIVTCVSAGNDFPDYTIGSPGTAAYVITVAATNDQNGVAFYSSNGDPAKNQYNLTKPDVAAPGGSIQVGNRIISTDSNDVDYEYSGQSDYTPNDYQQMMGTSMSTPHVAGLAALIVDAFSGWSWTKDEALKVKMIISMTAFEVQSGEGSNVPSLNRGDKDNVEGYGRICADAAIEAVTMTYTLGDLANDALGSDPWDKKVWARQVSLTAGTTYMFNLSVPSGADYDLYLYDGAPDNYGQPVILEKSVNASSGAQEIISFTSNQTSTYYIVVKWVSGSGVFNLESTPLVGFNLNLRVMDWDLTDSIQGAYVYVDSAAKASDAEGWANWTGVSGTVEIKVKYFGFWVNGTFSVTMDSDKTIDVQCRLYDVTCTVKPNNTYGVVTTANVTVFNATFSGTKIKSGITANWTGQVTLTNLPNSTLTFIVYAKSDYSVVIANVTRLISWDEQSETILADQNYGMSTQDWVFTVLPAGGSSVLSAGLTILPVNYNGRTKGKEKIEGS